MEIEIEMATAASFCHEFSFLWYCYSVALRCCLVFSLRPAFAAQLKTKNVSLSLGYAIEYFGLTKKPNKSNYSFVWRKELESEKDGGKMLAQMRRKQQILSIDIHAAGKDLSHMLVLVLNEWVKLHVEKVLPLR